MKNFHRFALAAAMMLLSWAASAATFVVTPQKDSDCSDLQCDFASALMEAGQNGEDDTIDVAEGVYHAGDFFMGFGYLGYYPLVSENFSLTLQGAGAGKTVLDGDGAQGFAFIDINLLSLAVDDAASVVVRDFTFQNTGQTALSIRTLQNGEASASIQDCVFDGTSTDIGLAAALAVYVGSGTADVSRNLFLNTPAASSRGPVSGYTQSGLFSLSDNVFYKNQAGAISGAWLLNETGVLNAVNNTFLENSAGCCGALAIEEYAPSGHGAVNVSNNIFWGNASNSLGADIYLNDKDNPANQGTPTNLINNDVSDIYSECLHDPACAPTAQVLEAGSVHLDPELVDPAHRDFHLGPASPLVDLGSAAAVGLPSIDFEGEPRILGGAPDIGADERPVCGDGIVSSGEECDSGMGAPDTCASGSPCVASGLEGECTCRILGGTTGGSAGGSDTGEATAAEATPSGGCGLIP